MSDLQGSVEERIAAAEQGEKAEDDDVDVAEKPLLPKEVEVRYLIDRVEDEIARHRGVLSKDALAEYESALATYRKLFETAR